MHISAKLDFFLLSINGYLLALFRWYLTCPIFRGNTSPLDHLSFLHNDIHLGRCMSLILDWGQGNIDSLPIPMFSYSPILNHLPRLTPSHCRCLDIYISKKKSVYINWKANFKQPAGHIYKLFDLKYQIYYNHFHCIFAGVVKSSAFCTLPLLFERVELP